MSTTVEVIELKGAIWCPRCTRRLPFDFNGRPPMARAIAACECGLTVHIRRLAMPSSLPAPQEVK